MAWVKLHDGFPEHPKLEAAGDLAGWLFVCALCYCNRAETDGFVPDGRVAKLTGLKQPERLAERLVEVGLFDRAEGGYEIHDYLEFQPSASDLKRQRDQKAERMARWRAKRRNGDAPVEGDVDASTPASRDAGVTLSPTPTPKEGGSNDPSRREDVEQLCALLADLICENGTPKGRIGWPSKGWRDAARLLLDKDERDAAEAETLIRWCQVDEFWRGNIESMPTFRRQYDKLRHRAATAGALRTQRPAANRIDTTDADLERALR